MDTEVLIEEVHKRTALWDCRSKEYSRRDVARRLWDEVAEVLNYDRDTVKKRWKNLRDNYRTELRRVKDKSKSGSAAKIKRTKWALFDSLDFLRDVLEPALLEGNLPSNENIGLFNAIESGTNSTNVLSSLEAEQSENNSNVEQSVPFSTRNIKKTKNNAEESEFLKLEREKLNLLKAESEIKNDADYNFLVSLLPHLKSLSQMSNLKLRMQTSALLLELKQSEENVTKHLHSVSSTPSISSASFDQNSTVNEMLSTGNVEFSQVVRTPVEFTHSFDQF